MGVSEDILACLRWLEQREFASAPEPVASINKAGILPLYTPTQECLLMKPVAKHKDLEAPGWQIAKGTRMAFVEGKWVDVKDESGKLAPFSLETLACTALREGMEEVGLKLGNIDFLHDVGLHGFSSTRSGKPKTMQIFICEVFSKDDFLPQNQLAKTTEKTAWFKLKDLPDDMRADNKIIINNIIKLYVKNHS